MNRKKEFLQKYSGKPVPEKKKRLIPDKARFAREAYRMTEKGADILKFAVETMNNPEMDMKHRLAAMQFLADRTFGKPKSDVEVTGGGNVSLTQNYIDLRGVSSEELAVLEKLVVNGAIRPASQKEVLDVECEEIVAEDEYREPETSGSD